MPVLVVTPLKREYDALVAALAELGHVGQQRPVGRLAALACAGGRLLVAQGGLGKTGFAIHTQHLIDHLEGLGLVVCAGTAGGLLAGLKAGDVVIGTATVEHDFRQRFVRRQLPHFDGHGPSISALANALKLMEKPFQVHFGPIASGDEDVVDPLRAWELHLQTGALAVGWEGAGGARACQFSGLPFLEVRGITDSADHGAPSAFLQNLPTAMRNVAAVVETLALIADAGH